MKEERVEIEFESMEEVYEIMRDNLEAAHIKLFDTVKDIGEDKKAIYEVLNDILEFCNLTYFTMDAMLQIQLGILKKTNPSRPGG